MTQFDAYSSRSGRASFFLINVQSDLLDALETRLVIPAYSETELRTHIPRLNPHVHIAGEPFILATQEMAAVPAKLLGKAHDNVAADRDRIIAAIDVLVTGL